MLRRKYQKVWSEILSLAVAIFMDQRKKETPSTAILIDDEFENENETQIRVGPVFQDELDVDIGNE